MDNHKIFTKKKNHFFEIYILKVLKQICEKSSMTINAKQQLNSILCIIAKKISSIGMNMCVLRDKKTISEKEVACAIKISLSGELLNNSILEGNKSVSNFKDNKPGNTKQDKASIIFPPSLAEKFLRKFGYYKIMVSTSAPVYLASVLEYITHEILVLARDNCIYNKRVRITVRDIEIVIRTDKELDNLFTKFNINLLGGGVVPFIHPFLLNKLNKNPIKQKNRRFHCGTVALRNIRKQQKFSDLLIFSKSSFDKFVREIFQTNNYNEPIKISKHVFIVLQYFIEQYITNILRNANYLAIHAGRIKITHADIGLVTFLIGKSENPYYDSTENIPEISIVNEDDSYISNLSHVSSFESNMTENTEN